MIYFNTDSNDILYVYLVYLGKGNGLRWAVAPPFELSRSKPVSHDWHGFVDSILMLLATYFIASEKMTIKCLHYGL